MQFFPSLWSLLDIFLNFSFGNSSTVLPQTKQNQKKSVFVIYNLMQQRKIMQVDHVLDS